MSLGRSVSWRTRTGAKAYVQPRKTGNIHTVDA
jgi:hypothetical protein